MTMLAVLAFLLCAVVSGGHGQPVQGEHCLIDNVAGCALGRPPIYLVTAPRRIRPGQVLQVFATLLRMEYGQNSINLGISVVRDDEEIANSVFRFERPSSRIMQLKVPSNADPGKYKLRVEGRLDALASGNIFFNETDIEFSPKYVSVFIQMSRPLYKQEQMVHFRVIPVKPDLMPKGGNLIIYVEDPSGIPVKRWQGLQTNAGGIVSQSFQLSDQPAYGTWNIRVDAFGHVYRHPFQVEEFWEPRFDVNVTVPAYVMDSERAVVRGVVMANHTSGRPCVGNMTLTAFFLPRDSMWNASRGWEKPYNDAQRSQENGASGIELQIPEYIAMKDVPILDYHRYFEYEYRVVDYYNGRLDFEWTRDELLAIAQRAGAYESLVNCEFVFFANVTDWYSDLNRTGWAGTILFDNTVNLEWVGGKIRTFKPGQLLKVQVAVSQFDGKPVLDGGSVTVTPTISASGVADPTSSHALTSPVVGGFAHFEIQLDLNAQSFELMATYTDLRSSHNHDQYRNTLFVNSERATITMTGTKYYSPSNTYITVTSSTDNPRVNEYMVFHVTTSHYVSRIYYQIISQSNVVIGDELEMTSRQKTFAVGLSRQMVPAARMVVYFLWQPEEIVSDVLTFFVNGTSQNMVTLGINRGKDFSRDTVEFNAYADPGSYVAFSGMLLDLYSRGLSDGITENKLIDELMTYDDYDDVFKQLQRVSDTEYEYKFFHGYDSGIDSTTTFENAGLLILTDADVTRLPNMDSCNPKLGYYPCFSGIESECFTDEQHCNGVLDGCPNDGADEWGCVYKDTDHATFESGLDRISRVMRYYDNSSWAWQEIFVKPDGRVDFRVDVPKYPLSWIINGISVSYELGLGIMRQPVRLDAARSMYIQVEHPKYIVWGEQIGVRVTVFNYWYDDDYLEVMVTMDPGPNGLFVLVEDMGWVVSYNPRTHEGKHETILFLEPGQSQDIYMPIVAKKEYHGKKLEFTVTATCFMQTDEYAGEMFMQPNGVLNYYHTPYLVDLIRYPAVQSPSFKVEVQENYREVEIRENVYVPQSPKAVVTLFGDVVTPGFYEDILTAESILYRPYGSGEGVTFNFAYNMLVMLFQRSSDQVKDEEAQRVLRDLNIVLQRMLSYMNTEDGSFKMFRDDEHSSLWLTAFVGKTLSWARIKGDMESYIYIPDKLLSKIVDYICSKQNSTTGAFDPLEGDLALDRKMASLGHSKNNVMLTHRIPLTAYILICLSEITGFSNSIEPAKREAANFLSEQATNLGNDEMFFMAISAYALTLTQTTTDLVTRLWDERRDDSDYLYFADQQVYSNPTKMFKTEFYLDPRQEQLNDAYAVQTTAYALMAHIKSSRQRQSERDDAMAFLNTMRNSFAGFASTQDTIVAMEALWLYATENPNRNEFHLDVSLSVSSMREWEHYLHIPENDFTLVHQASLPENKVFGFIRSDSDGVGRAMLQLTTTKRVEHQQYIKTQMRYDNDPMNDPIPFFGLELETDWAGKNNSIMFMRSCVSWLYTERSLTSGLAVLEIDLPTGYVVMNDTLRDYVRSGIVPNLRRAEFYQRKAVYYFDHLDASDTCINLRADRWYPVANTTKENRIRVYDYYEPGMHHTRLYTVQGLNLMNICFACGSYQCPYCPYFNTAVTVLRLGATWCYILLFVYLGVRHWLQR